MVEKLKINGDLFQKPRHEKTEAAIDDFRFLVLSLKSTQRVPFVFVRTGCLSPCDPKKSLPAAFPQGEALFVKVHNRVGSAVHSSPVCLECEAGKNSEAGVLIDLVPIAV